MKHHASHTVSFDSTLEDLIYKIDSWEIFSEFASPEHIARMNSQI